MKEDEEYSHRLVFAILAIIPANDNDRESLIRIIKQIGRLNKAGIGNTRILAILLSMQPGEMKRTSAPHHYPIE